MEREGDKTKGRKGSEELREACELPAFHSPYKTQPYDTLVYRALRLCSLLYYIKVFQLLGKKNRDTKFTVKEMSKLISKINNAHPKLKDSLVDLRRGLAWTAQDAAFPPRHPSV